MKCLLLLLISNFAIAGIADVVEPGECVQVPYTITGRINKHAYYMTGFSRHAVLKTTKTTFDSMGKTYVPMKYIASKMIPMDNGFEEKFDFWEVCEDMLEKYKKRNMK